MSGEVVSTEGDNKALRLCADARDEGPMCDHTCLLRDDHVEAGQPHFYGYRLGPGSLSHSLAEVERLRAELASRDQALDQIRALAEEWRAQAALIRQGKTSQKRLRAGIRDAAASDVQRILSDLSEHQEEAK